MKKTKKNHHNRLVVISFVFVLLFAIQNIFAQTQSNTDNKYSIEFKNEQLASAFKKLEKISGYNMLFTYEDLQDFRVTTTLTNQTLIQILDEILKNKPLKYTISNKNVSIVKKQSETKIQQAKSNPTASGLVVTADGQPLPFAAVMIKGTRTGTTADSKGYFNLPNTPVKSVLVVSMLGMKSQEVEFDGKNELKIILEMDALELKGTVVTGIFNKSRESYTGSVTSVTSQNLTAYRGQNVVATLKNFDPALNIVYSNESGSNPNALPKFDIRGNSSLPNNIQEFNQGVANQINAPLIIMDGFEISLSRLMDFNSEEIQSINILKDASATAIYGSRGANGVVVITSKPPQEGNLRINFQTGANIEIPDLTSYNLLNAVDKLELEKKVGLYSSEFADENFYRGNLYSERLKEVLAGVNSDWLSQPLQIGIGQRYNIRFEGGSEKFKWGVNAQYNKTTGAMKGSERKTFSGSINLAYTYKNLIFKNQTNITQNKAIESKYGNFSNYASMQPYYRIHNSDGTLRQTFYNYWSQLYVQNPLYDAQLNTINESGYDELINNFSIEWKINKNLIARGQLGLSKNLGSKDYFLPAEHSSFLTGFTGEDAFRKGSYTYTTSNNITSDANATISYTNIFKDKHQLYTGLNYSVYQNNYYTYQFVAEGFSNEELSFIGNALQYAQNGKPSGSESKTRRVGFTGNVNYTFDNRYFVDISVRTDGSSQFGSKNKFAPFWSTGIGWNLHNEKFLKTSEVINSLRVKASIGQTGSQQFSAYQALRTYQYYTGNKYIDWSGAYLLALGNENLKWQITDQINLGTEFSLLKNRLTGSFDYYTKSTSNLLSSMDIPAATGFNSFVENIGKVKNTGYEASLSGYLIQNYDKQIVWIITGKMSYNKNIIVKLSDAIKAQNEQYKIQGVDVSNLFYEGYSQSSIYAVRSLGIDPATGTEIFLDKNNDITTTWSASDKVYLGVGDQPYRATLSSMLSVGNFVFNISLASHWGGKVYNSTLLNKVELTNSQIGNSNVDHRVLEERWSKPGDLTFFKAYSNTATRATSRFVMDDKTFEIQSASIQYKWNSKFVKKLKFETITFSGNMSDILYLSTIKRERGTSYPFARRVNLSIAFLF